MDVITTNSVMIRPACDIPSEELWLSNVDLFVNFYTLTLFIYGPKERSDICVWRRLREALPKVLVHFYPLAGRLMNDSTREIAINCNSEGVVFLEAVAASDIKDLGDFSSRSQLGSLVPTIDYSQSINSLPLLIVQMTKFKYGGVTVGVALHHVMADMVSFLHFLNTWSDMARGIDAMVPPYIDRTLLRARDPPQPYFSHLEYQPSPTLLHEGGLEERQFPLSYERFRLSKKQLDCLKEKARDNPSKEPFTSFVALSAHVWKCACISGNLLDKQETKLFMPVNGRERIHPTLPRGYFGNAVFPTSVIAISGEIVSHPIWHIAKKIKDGVENINDQYIRSQLDYLELNLDKRKGPSGQQMLYPNLIINNWASSSIHTTNFGWGKPLFMGNLVDLPEGFCLIKRNPEEDGSLMVEMTLRIDRMDRFGKLFYKFFDGNSGFSKL